METEYRFQEKVKDVQERGELCGSQRIIMPEDVEAQMVSIKSRRYGQNPSYCMYWDSRAIESDFGQMARSDPRLKPNFCGGTIR